jgi:hypothetical protein
MVKSELIRLVQILDGSDIHAAGDRLWNLRMDLLAGEDTEPWRNAAIWLHELGVIDDDILGDCIIFFTESEPRDESCTPEPVEADAEDDDEDDRMDEDDDEDAADDDDDAFMDDDEYEFADSDDEDAVESELGHAALASRIRLPVCGSPEARLHQLTPNDQRRFEAGEAFDARLLAAYVRGCLPAELAGYVARRLRDEVAFHEAFRTYRKAA